MKQYWCMHCQGVFSAPEKPDECPIPGCDGLSIDFHETVPEQLFDPWPDHWPNKLEEGQIYPLYP